MRITLVGNEALLKLGGSNEASLRARVVAHENVLNRLVAAPARVADAASINDTYFRSPKDFLFNGEAVWCITCPTRIPTATASCCFAGRMC